MAEYLHMYTYFYLLYIAIIDHSTSTYFSTDTTCVASTYISSYVHIGRPKCVLTVLTDAHRTTIAGGAWWAGGGRIGRMRDGCGKTACCSCIL